MLEPRQVDRDEIEGGKIRPTHTRAQRLDPIQDTRVVRMRCGQGKMRECK